MTVDTRPLTLRFKHNVNAVRFYGTVAAVDVASAEIDITLDDGELVENVRYDQSYPNGANPAVGHRVWGWSMAGELLVAGRLAVSGETDRIGEIELQNAAPEDLPGEIGLDTATASVLDTGGTYTVQIQRAGGSKGTAAVRLHDLLSGTAVAGTDYTAIPDTIVSWADGDTAVKTVAITILNGSAVDVVLNIGLDQISGTGAEPFFVTLGLDALALTIVNTSVARDLALAVATSSDLNDGQELTAGAVLSDEVYVYLSEEPTLQGGSWGDAPGNVTVREWHYGDGTLPNQATLDALVNTDPSFIRDDDHFQGDTGGIPDSWNTAANPPETAAGGSPGSEPTVTEGAVITSDGGATTITPVNPAHAIGDHLVAHLVTKGAPTITPPTGWVQQGPGITFGTTSSLRLFLHVATSAAEANPEFTQDGTGDMLAKVVGHAGTAGFDKTPEFSQITFAADVAPVPAYTTLVDDCAVRRVFGQDQSDTHTWATSTELDDDVSPSGSRASMTDAKQSKATAGSVAAENLTRAGGANSSKGVVVTYAMKPSSSGQVGSNADGNHWIACKITHSRSGGPTSGTTIGVQIELANDDPPPPPTTSTIVPTGLISQFFGGYNGGNQGGEFTYNAINGLGLTTYMAHRMAAPSHGDIPSSLVNGFDTLLANDLAAGKLAPAQLISLQTYDDTNFNSTLTARVPKGTAGERRVDQDAGAQAAAYDEVIAGDKDADLITIGNAVSDMLAICQYVFLQIPGQELVGDWQGHAPFAANTAKHKAMMQHAYDTIWGQLTAAEQLRCFSDWSCPKRSSRPTAEADIRAFYPGDDISPVTGRSYVDSHSINMYIDVALASEHITPAGPFGTLANKSNIIASNKVQTVLNRLVSFSNWGAEKQVAFAIEKGKPIGMGEGAPGAGNKLGDSGWCGDDPDMTEAWLQWWHDEVVLSSVGLCYFAWFGSNAGGVGSRFRTELPLSWARMGQFVSAH